MGDYGRELEFGVSVVPNADDVPLIREVAARADALGLELLGIQDHPYQQRFVETWSLLGDLLARTERLRLFPDVTNLPLRLPAMVAKQAATLDVLSGGRFELGLGAGASWEGIEAMGASRRTPGESIEALEEAIEIARRFWTGDRGIRFEGRHYTVAGLHAGPPPAHEIEIWLGVYKPRGLALVGRLADGWLPSMAYAPPETIPERQARIDDAAVAAGRDPAAIRRLYNVGEVEPGRLAELAVEVGFDTFVYWPRDDQVRRVEEFAGEVVPAVREAVAAARGR